MGRKGETLGQVSPRSCGRPVAGNVQGQTGHSFEQPDLLTDVPAYAADLDHVIFKSPSIPNHPVVP